MKWSTIIATDMDELSLLVVEERIFVAVKNGGG
jgi:hypothetical protein